MEAQKSEEAAVKIQAGYRGYVARKEVEAMKSSNSAETAVEGKGMNNICEKLHGSISRLHNEVQLNIPFIFWH